VRLRAWDDVWHLIETLASRHPELASQLELTKGDALQMSMPALFKGRLSIPVIGSPLFIISVPDLVIAQCKAGVVGAFPALNARPPALLDEWLARITEELAAHDKAHPEAPSAPFAVNQIVHRSNNRLEHDLALCEKYRVPVIITSLGAREELNRAAHNWGGIVFHDVINQMFAHKAVEKGADGLILVAAGAGGHAGTISPLAFVAETRQWFDGPIALSGAIANGRAIRAARVLGADFAYIGSAFIATREANAVDRYKEMITSSGAEDIVYSNLFTGVHGNYLKPSIVAAGMDPANLPISDPSKMNFGTDASGERAKPKAWKEIWGSGQGVGSIGAILPAAELIARFKKEYDEAVDPPL
jgi:nitronate monooxygenase